jgi:putative Holliday junction resolvase
MKILGIDYGRARIGLALAEGRLAAPYCVLKVKSMEQAVEKTLKVIQAENIEKVVVGVSEGKMAKEQRQFAEDLRQKTEVLIDLWDETLSSQDAIQAAVEAKVPRKKMKRLEDAFAATIMLQSYLDCI